MPESLDRSISSLSISSVASQSEDDWDRSLTPQSQDFTSALGQVSTTTPRNSIIFPANETPGRASRYSSIGTHSRHGSVDSKGGKRTLSELLRLHSEKGTNGRFSAEEASRIADVLGQWINASSSPYEGEDDFFVPSQSQDDMSIASKRPIPVELALIGGRPRGRSESANSIGLQAQTSSSSRPPSSLAVQSS